MISDEDLAFFASAHMGGTIGSMASEILQRREEEQKPCEWKYNIKQHWYETGCDSFIGSFTGHNYKFCPFCGHRIEEAT